MKNPPSPLEKDSRSFLSVVANAKAPKGDSSFTNSGSCLDQPLRQKSGTQSHISADVLSAISAIDNNEVDLELMKQMKESQFEASEMSTI